MDKFDDSELEWPEGWPTPDERRSDEMWQRFMAQAAQERAALEQAEAAAQEQAEREAEAAKVAADQERRDLRMRVAMLETQLNWMQLEASLAEPEPEVQPGPSLGDVIRTQVLGAILGIAGAEFLWRRFKH